MLEVRVNPSDIGKVIGRSGRTATALRTVVGALAGQDSVRIDFVDVDKPSAAAHAADASTRHRPVPVRVRGGRTSDPRTRANFWCPVHVRGRRP